MRAHKIHYSHVHTYIHTLHLNIIIYQMVVIFEHRLLYVTHRNILSTELKLKRIHICEVYIASVYNK